jgi:PP-loop superfamily ATP-utilizing enzyme
MKTYKPLGKFFEDVETLCRMFNLRVHPAMKALVTLNAEGEKVEEEKPKEVNTLNFYKHRLDKNSMKVLFLALQSAPYIHTLK